MVMVRKKNTPPKSRTFLPLSRSIIRPFLLHFAIKSNPRWQQRRSRVGGLLPLCFALVTHTHTHIHLRTITPTRTFTGEGKGGVENERYVMAVDYGEGIIHPSHRVTGRWEATFRYRWAKDWHIVWLGMNIYSRVNFVSIRATGKGEERRERKGEESCGRKLIRIIHTVNQTTAVRCVWLEIFNERFSWNGKQCSLQSYSWQQTNLKMD